MKIIQPSAVPAEPATSPLFTGEVSRQPILTPEMSQNFNLVQLIRNNYSSLGRQGRSRGHDLGHRLCGPVKRTCLVIPFLNELVQLCMKLIFGCKIHNA